jgi:hypothetical protein
VYAHIAAEPVEELDALLLSDEGGEDDEMQLEGLELGEEQQEELDVDAALAGMEANVRALETSLHQSRPVPAAALDADAEVPGWSRAEGWTPCPLGVWA